MLRELALGQQIRKSRAPRWNKIDQRIRNIVAQYDDYEAEGMILDYLRAIGYHLLF